MAAHLSGSPTPPGSATIYTFPPRGRFALRDAGNGLTAAANMQLPHGARFASASSGWYHDDAIRADEGRDH
jgi:hypothetical protein